MSGLRQRSARHECFRAAGTIVWATIKQQRVPGELLGRVSSVDWLISIGLLPVSLALTAPLATTLGVRTTLVAAGITGAAATLGGLLLPGMRAGAADAPCDPGRRPDVTARRPMDVFACVRLPGGPDHTSLRSRVVQS